MNRQQNRTATLRSSGKIIKTKLYPDVVARKLKPRRKINLASKLQSKVKKSPKPKK